MNLSYELSDFAAKHPNDLISNALSRLSQKVDKYGDTFYTNLNETEKKVLSYFMKNK